MPQLLRIILIHTHLPGIVEIQLDQHTMERMLPERRRFSALFQFSTANSPIKSYQERGRSSTSFISPGAIAMSFMNISEKRATIAWLF